MKKNHKIEFLDNSFLQKMMQNLCHENSKNILRNLFHKMGYNLKFFIKLYFSCLDTVTNEKNQFRFEFSWSNI